MHERARIDPPGKDDDIGKDDDDEDDDIYGGNAFEEMAPIVPGGDNDAGGTGGEKQGDNLFSVIL